MSTPSGFCMPLCGSAGKARLKLSPRKLVLPGRRQVFRFAQDREDIGDTIARADENLPGRPLLAPVMREVKRLPAGRVDLETARRYAREEFGRLPARVRNRGRADPPYPVAVSEALLRFLETVKKEGAS